MLWSGFGSEQREYPVQIGDSVPAMNVTWADPDDLTALDAMLDEIDGDPALAGVKDREHMKVGPLKRRRIAACWHVLESGKGDDFDIAAV